MSHFIKGDQVRIVRIILVITSSSFFTGCATEGLAHKTFLSSVEHSVSHQHEYAKDEKVCSDKANGNYSTDCVRRAEAMANIECVIDRQGGHSTDKQKSRACSCFESGEDDEQKLCTAWLDFKKSNGD